MKKPLLRRVLYGVHLGLLFALLLFTFLGCTLVKFARYSDEMYDAYYKTRALSGRTVEEATAWFGTSKGGVQYFHSANVQPGESNLQGGILIYYPPEWWWFYMRWFDCLATRVAFNQQGYITGVRTILD